MMRYMVVFNDEKKQVRKAYFENLSDAHSLFNLLRGMSWSPGLYSFEPVHKLGHMVEPQQEKLVPKGS